MKDQGSLQNERRWNVHFWFVLAAGLAALGFGAYELLSLSFSDIAVLAASAFVAVLVSQYDVRIPKTNIIFTPKIIFVFWGIVSLGIAGGVCDGLDI